MRRSKREQCIPLSVIRMHKQVHQCLANHDMLIGFPTPHAIHDLKRNREAVGQPTEELVAGSEAISFPNLSILPLGLSELPSRLRKIPVVEQVANAPGSDRILLTEHQQPGNRHPGLSRFVVPAKCPDPSQKPGIIEIVVQRTGGRV